MSKPHLVSFDLCPYVQRSAIALQLKGVEYDLTYVDLANKPDWFLELSPLGKVPVLRVGDTTLFESSVIAEYLDEAFEPTLHPADALQRAYHRAWGSYAGEIGGPAYMLMITSDEEKAREHAAKARTMLTRLEEQVTGPFFAGDEMKMVDALAAPFLQRLLWTDARKPELDLFGDVPKVRAWVEALVAHPAVKASLLPDIEERFDAYLAKYDAWIGRA